jgi:hypothetical protein
LDVFLNGFIAGISIAFFIALVDSSNVIVSVIILTVVLSVVIINYVWDRKRTSKLTRPPTSLAINFVRCNLLGLAQEIARGRGSALNALLA